MRKFETLLLLSPELGAEPREALITSFSAIIERMGGKVITVDNWGMRDLAYPVQKQMRGFYIRLEFGGPSTVVAELERIVRITEGVFKFVTIKLADKLEEVV